MKLVAFLLLFTVSTLVHVSQTLDDDEADADQKYTVSFFQFNPKDLAIGGMNRKREHSKKNFKRSDSTDTLPKPLNTTAVNTTNNAAAAVEKPSNASSVANTTTAAADNTTAALSNATVGKLNSSSENKPQESNTTSAMTRDTDIMNTLIDMAMKKNLTASPNDLHNTTLPDSHADIAINGEFATKNSSVVDPKVNINLKNDSGNATTSATKGDVPVVKGTKKATIGHKDALNPNPMPSENEALLNLKHPKQMEGKPHDANIHSENTTKLTESEDKQSSTNNVVTMEKLDNPEPEKGAELLPVAEPKNKTDSTANAENATLTPEEKERRKIEKDKQTNREIKENAKDIKPVQNTVGKINVSMHNIMKDDTTKFVKDSKKAAPGRSKVDHVDPTKAKHRNNVAKFVPLYKTSAKDHKLSFQIGAMKHPKHNIHPKCHACPLNSSYKECVKKSTLTECDKGLDNICFTKSTKKNGLITYQMGCANHNKCVNAKAFPCKDNREHCFTCCQYDRCNSSPHHGDYELDELNLDELSDNIVSSDNKDTTKLDSSSATDTISGSWMAYLSTIIVVLALHL